MKQLLKAMFSVPQQYQPQTQQNNNEEQNNDDIEQSQADGLMTDDSDIMFPEDEY
jgi:hypothetical protein